MGGKRQKRKENHASFITQHSKAQDAVGSWWLLGGSGNAPQTKGTNERSAVTVSGLFKFLCLVDFN